MKKFILKFSKLFFLVSILTIFSCSKDDDGQACMQTNTTLTVNGEVQSFQAIGRGISLRPNGYELSLNFYRNATDSSGDQNIALILPYKKTGKNSVEHFYYSQYLDQSYFQGDFTEGDFQINVLKNTSECFYATFSGKLTDGENQITIEQGTISYTYEESFDE